MRKIVLMAVSLPLVVLMVSCSKNPLKDYLDHLDAMEKFEEENFDEPGVGKLEKARLGTPYYYADWDYTIFMPLHEDFEFADALNMVHNQHLNAEIDTCNIIAYNDLNIVQLPDDIRLTSVDIKKDENGADSLAFNSGYKIDPLQWEGERYVDVFVETQPMNSYFTDISLKSSNTDVISIRRKSNKHFQLVFSDLGHAEITMTVTDDETVIQKVFPINIVLPVELKFKTFGVQFDGPLLLFEEDKSYNSVWEPSQLLVSPGKVPRKYRKIITKTMDSLSVVRRCEFYDVVKYGNLRLYDYDTLCLKTNDYVAMNISSSVTLHDLRKLPSRFRLSYDPTNLSPRPTDHLLYSPYRIHRMELYMHSVPLCPYIKFNGTLSKNLQKRNTKNQNDTLPQSTYDLFDKLSKSDETIEDFAPSEPCDYFFVQLAPLPTQAQRDSVMNILSGVDYKGLTKEQLDSARVANERYADGKRPGSVEK